jgi:hypothetical protein
MCDTRRERFTGLAAVLEKRFHLLDGCDFSAIFSRFKLRESARAERHRCVLNRLLYTFVFLLASENWCKNSFSRAVRHVVRSGPELFCIFLQQLISRRKARSV